MKLTGISKLKSGAFTLEFKQELPQDAGKGRNGDNLEVRNDL